MLHYSVDIKACEILEQDDEYKNSLVEYAKKFLPRQYSDLNMDLNLTKVLPSAVECTRLLAYKSLFVLLNDYCFYGRLEQLPVISYHSCGGVEKGKPYFKDYPRIHFNISHTVGAVACAICEKEIGIDIEQYVDRKRTRLEVSERLINRVCNENDCAMLSRPYNTSDFLNIWTIKESVVKADGCGIAVGLPNVVIDYNNYTAKIGDKKYVYNVLEEDILFDKDSGKQQFFCCYATLY